MTKHKPIYAIQELPNETSKFQIQNHKNKQTLAGSNATEGTIFEFQSVFELRARGPKAKMELVRF